MKKNFCYIFFLLISMCLYCSCSGVYTNQSEKVSFNNSKNGVDAFYSLLENKEDGHINVLNKESCYNITTDNLKSLNIKIFKFKDECDTYLQYGQNIYRFGESFGGYGFINGVTCDIDNNGVADIVFTYSFGSGVHRSVVSLFNMTTFKMMDLFSTFDSTNQSMGDLVLEKKVKNEKAIYNAYSAEIGFTDFFLAGSFIEKELYKSFDIEDYASNEYYDVIVGSDSNDQENNFEIKVSNFNNNQTFTKPDTYPLTLNVCNPIYLHLILQKNDWIYGQDNLNSVNISYDDKFFDVLYFSSNDASRSITYLVYPMEKFSNKEITVSYKNDIYKLNVNSIDFDFSNTQIVKDDLDGKFKEFKEMVDSIKYHEYTSPYPGLDSYGGSDYWKEYSYTYEFNEQYDLDYLDYLKDSVYYPSKMDLAFENIGSRTASMTFNDQKIVEANTDRALMGLFSVGYGVIDPGCTKPTNPLDYIAFKAVPKNYPSTNSHTKKTIDLYLHQTYYLLSNLYPEQYLNYQVGDLSIQIIQIGDSLQGYFADENYVYMLDCSYVFSR